MHLTHFQGCSWEQAVLMAKRGEGDYRPSGCRQTLIDAIGAPGWVCWVVFEHDPLPAAARLLFGSDAVLFDPLS